MDWIGLDRAIVIITNTWTSASLAYVLVQYSRGISDSKMVRWSDGPPPPIPDPSLPLSKSWQVQHCRTIGSRANQCVSEVVIGVSEVGMLTSRSQSVEAHFTGSSWKRGC